MGAQCPKWVPIQRFPKNAKIWNKWSICIEYSVILTCFLYLPDAFVNSLTKNRPHFNFFSKIVFFQQGYPFWRSQSSNFPIFWKKHEKIVRPGVGWSPGPSLTALGPPFGPVMIKYYIRGHNNIILLIYHAYSIW